MELKKIDLNASSFMANGKEYFREVNISIQRSVYAEAAKIELETGLQAGKWLQDWEKVYKLANELKFSDIVILAYNNMRGFHDFFKKHHPVLKLCACFINTEDEDRRTITDDLVDKKINDWAEEGIAMQNFFAWSLAFLRIEVEGFSKATETILELIKEFNTKTARESTPITTSN